MDTDAEKDRSEEKGVPAVKPAEGNAHTNGLPTIHTYESDVAELVKKGGTSLSSIVLKEKERARLAPPSVVALGERSNRRFALIGAAILLVGAGIIGGTIAFIRSRHPDIPPTVPNLPRLLLADKVLRIPIDGKNADTIRRELNKILATPIPLSEVTEVSFTSKADGTERAVQSTAFFETLALGAPGTLTRSLDDAFTIGAHGFRKNERFLVVKVRYFQNAFGALLDWEKTMPDDLRPLFPSIPPPEALLPGEVSRRRFEDSVIRNRDTRILRDENGSAILLYTFPDPKTLVFTTSEETLAEVTKRLIATKFVQ